MRKLYIFFFFFTLFFFFSPLVNKSVFACTVSEVCTYAGVRSCWCFTSVSGIKGCNKVEPNSDCYPDNKSYTWKGNDCTGCSGGIPEPEDATVHGNVTVEGMTGYAGPDGTAPEQGMPLKAYCVNPKSWKCTGWGCDLEYRCDGDHLYPWGPCSWSTSDYRAYGISGTSGLSVKRDGTISPNWTSRISVDKGDSYCQGSNCHDTGACMYANGGPYFNFAEVIPYNTAHTFTITPPAGYYCKTMTLSGGAAATANGCSLTATLGQGSHNLAIVLTVAPPNPTCTFTTAPTGAYKDQNVSYGVTGTGTNPGRIQIFRRKTDGSDSWTQAGSDCNNALTCSRTTQFPSTGTYYVACNAFVGASLTPKCSGNPWCPWSPVATPQVACTGWVDCGPNDVVTVLVTQPTGTVSGGYYKDNNGNGCKDIGETTTINNAASSVTFGVINCTAGVSAYSCTASVGTAANVSAVPNPPQAVEHTGCSNACPNTSCFVTVVSGNTTLDLMFRDNPSGWLQAKNGDVYGSSVGLTIPLVTTGSYDRWFLDAENATSRGGLVLSSGAINAYDGASSDRASERNWKIPNYTTPPTFPSSLSFAAPAGAAPFPAWGAGILTLTPNTTYTSGTATLNGRYNSGAGVAVVYVNGDLTIDGDINKQGNGGLVFVVNGKVTINNIDSGNAKVDALIIANGMLTTANCATNCGKELKIQGGIYAGGFTFSRTLTDNRKPAIYVEFDPVYLALPPAVLSASRYDWQEIAP